MAENLEWEEFTDQEMDMIEQLMDNTIAAGPNLSEDAYMQLGNLDAVSTTLFCKFFHEFVGSHEMDIAYICSPPGGRPEN